MHYQPLFTRSSYQKMAKLKALSICQNIFFSIKLLYAHLQYVCNISATSRKDLKKALGEVDFIKYVLSVII